MSIEDAIAAAVEARLSKRLERIEKALALGGEDLADLKTAAKAVGLHPDTVRKKYLKKLKVHGKGRGRRISVAELRQRMLEEAGAEVSDSELDRRADALARGGH